MHWSRDRPAAGAGARRRAAGGPGERSAARATSCGRGGAAASRGHSGPMRAPAAAPTAETAAQGVRTRKAHPLSCLAGSAAGRGAAEASVEGRGSLSEVVGWRCLPPGSRSVGAASRRLAFRGTGRAHRQSGAFDAGRCVRHSDVAHRSVGCIRAQPCTRCDCHWRRSGHMHRALVAAAAARGQEADSLRSRARPRDFLHARASS